MPKIEVIYGEGRGKTTNAIGKIIFEITQKKKISVVQFLKTKKDSGEYNFFLHNENIKWYTLGKTEFFNPKEPNEEYKLLIEKGTKSIIEELNKDLPDILLLDELGMAFYFNLISEQLISQLLGLATQRIIITGRKVPTSLIHNSALNLEISEKKHPYQKGILARRGIDY